MTGRPRRFRLGVTVALLALAAVGWPLAQAQEPTLRLRLLSTTDIHTHIVDYDYYRDQPDNSLGLARTATSALRKATKFLVSPRLARARPRPQRDCLLRFSRPISRCSHTGRTFSCEPHIVAAAPNVGPRHGLAVVAHPLGPLAQESALRFEPSW